jgi:hypothetical protein
MAWKCPDCGKVNETKATGCACGYASYKILGIAPDASPEDTVQTYSYLLKVWGTEDAARDAHAKKKAEERLNRIKQAYTIFSQHFPPPSVPEKKPDSRKLAFLVSAGVLLLIIGLIVVYSIVKSNERQETVELQNAKIQEIPSPASIEPVQTTPEENNTSVYTSVESEEEQAFAEIDDSAAEKVLGGDMTDEMAIDLVKKSNAMYKRSTVEAIIDKWNEDNTGKLEFLGWRAKKMDELSYLVSYTALDGAVTRGFYFSVNTETGAVQHLANNPELQKKFNIQYSE